MIVSYVPVCIHLSRVLGAIFDGLSEFCGHQVLVDCVRYPYCGFEDFCSSVTMSRYLAYFICWNMLGLCLSSLTYELR